MLNFLPHFKPPFKVERLSLDQVHLRKRDKQAIRSLSAGQLEALAQLARLLGTVVREEQLADGCMLFWHELLKTYNKQQAEKKKEETKAKKASAKAKDKPLTWKTVLLYPPR